MDTPESVTKSSAIKHNSSPEKTDKKKHISPTQKQVSPAKGSVKTIIQMKKTKSTMKDHNTVSLNSDSELKDATPSPLRRKTTLY